VGSKKQRSIPHDESSLAAMFRRVGEKQIREDAHGAKQAEWIVRTALGDEAGSLLTALPPEDRAMAAYEMFQRIKDGRMNFDDAPLWLEMRRDRTLHRLEQAANAADNIKADRSRGGQISSATQRARWGLWRAAFCKYARVSDPNDAPPHVKKRWVDAIRFRSGEKKMSKPQLYADVPSNLPSMKRNNKPPSVGTIRLNLFGHRGR
jgi:hypothetical protein